MKELMKQAWEMKKIKSDKTTLSEADFNNAKQATDAEFTALRKGIR